MQIAVQISFNSGLVSLMLEFSALMSRSAAINCRYARHGRRVFICFPQCISIAGTVCHDLHIVCNFDDTKSEDNK